MLAETISILTSKPTPPGTLRAATFHELFTSRSGNSRPSLSRACICREIFSLSISQQPRAFWYSRCYVPVYYFFCSPSSVDFESKQTAQSEKFFARLKVRTGKKVELNDHADATCNSSSRERKNHETSAVTSAPRQVHWTLCNAVQRGQCDAKIVGERRKQKTFDLHLKLFRSFRSIFVLAFRHITSSECAAQRSSELLWLIIPRAGQRASP